MKLFQKVLITATTSTQLKTQKLCLEAVVMMITSRRVTKKQPTICQLHFHIRERVYNPFWLPR